MSNFRMVVSHKAVSRGPEGPREHFVSLALDVDVPKVMTTEFQKLLVKQKASLDLEAVRVCNVAVGGSPEWYRSQADAIKAYYEALVAKIDSGEFGGILVEGLLKEIGEENG